MKKNPARRRLPIPQHEFGFEAFNLMQEQGSDGDRLARERDEKERRRARSGRAQGNLFMKKNPARQARYRVTHYGYGEPTVQIVNASWCFDCESPQVGFDRI